MLPSMDRPLSPPPPALSVPFPLAWTLCGVTPLPSLPCAPCLETNHAIPKSSLGPSLQDELCLLPSPSPTMDLEGASPSSMDLSVLPSPINSPAPWTLHARDGPCAPPFGDGLLSPAPGCFCSPWRNMTSSFATGMREVWGKGGPRSSGDLDLLPGAWRDPAQPQHTHWSAAGPFACPQAGSSCGRGWKGQCGGPLGEG